MLWDTHVVAWIGRKIMSGWPAARWKIRIPGRWKDMSTRIYKSDCFGVAVPTKRNLLDDTRHTKDSSGVHFSLLATTKTLALVVLCKLAEKPQWKAFNMSLRNIMSKKIRIQWNNLGLKVPARELTGSSNSERYVLVCRWIKLPQNVTENFVLPGRLACTRSNFLSVNIHKRHGAI
jgi:hypothetical protein